jgi:hypothetical protein
VVVTSNPAAGLGNRIQAAVAGFLVALLTQRVFFLKWQTQERTVYEIDSISQVEKTLTKFFVNFWLPG